MNVETNHGLAYADHLDADTQVSGEEAIAALLFDRLQELGATEEMCGDLGRDALRLVLERFRRDLFVDDLRETFVPAGADIAQITLEGSLNAEGLIVLTRGPATNKPDHWPTPVIVHDQTFVFEDCDGDGDRAWATYSKCTASNNDS